MAGLPLAHQLVGFGIEEIRMRIERAQHVGDRALKHRVVGIHVVGEVALHRFIDLGKLLQACVDVRLGLRGEATGRGQGAEWSPGASGAIACNSTSGDFIVPILLCPGLGLATNRLARPKSFHGNAPSVGANGDQAIQVGAQDQGPVLHGGAPAPGDADGGMSFQNRPR